MGENVVMEIRFPCFLLQYILHKWLTLCFTTHHEVVSEACHWPRWGMGVEIHPFSTCWRKKKKKPEWTSKGLNVSLLPDLRDKFEFYIVRRWDRGGHAFGTGSLPTLYMVWDLTYSQSLCACVSFFRVLKSIPQRCPLTSLHLSCFPFTPFHLFIFTLSVSWKSSW